MPKEAHSVLYDDDGDPYEVWAKDGDVYLWVPTQGVVLGHEQQDAHGQAFIGAANAADRQRAASRV